MKIWYLSAYDQPRGQSTRTYDFSRELVRRGHKVTFFTNSYCHFTHENRENFRRYYFKDVIDEIDVVWIKTLKYKGNGIGRILNMFDNAIKVFFISLRIKSQPDVVVAPSVPLLTGLAGLFIAKKYRIPFVFEVRDVWPDALVDMGGLKKNSFSYIFLRAIEKKLYQKSTYISSTLPALSSHVLNSGADPEKIVFIPNGIDLKPYEKYQSVRPSAIKPLVVMYIGGFGLDHDVRTIIESAKILNDMGDESFYFIIIGDGARKSEMVALANKYTLPNLEMRPPIPKAGIPSMQSRADILIASITSSDSYRFGLNLNKLCSYLASGRPVVFSGNPPNDPVKESCGGISVEAENPPLMVEALKQVAELDVDERIVMGLNGISYANTNINIKYLGVKMESMLLSAVAMNS